MNKPERSDRPPQRPEIVAFNEHLVEHQRLVDVGREAMSAVINVDAEFVILRGPSGVGKTTALDKLHRDLLASWGPYSVVGSRPVIRILTDSPGPQGFRMKDWYHAILEALDEPGIGEKVELSPAGQDQDSRARRGGETESAARSACLAAIRRRGVRVILTDEAQQLVETGGYAHRTSVLESLKVLALATGVVIVLVGTYALDGLVVLNEQVSRRARVIPFTRYLSDVHTDQEWFLSIVANFEQRVGMSSGSLTGDMDEVYSWCNGCVGTLKVHLRRGLDRALYTGQPMTLDFLRPDTQRRRALAYELAEIKFAETGLWADGPPDRPIRPLWTRVDRTSAPRTKPFQRKPTRDPVGRTLPRRS